MDSGKKNSFEIGGGGVLESQNPKCEDLPKFQFGGEGFWVRSDLDSGKKIRVLKLGGGVLGKVRFGLMKEN